MFEASLISLLHADTALVGLLSSYSSNPSVFTSVAPQKAEPPYIVFEIEEYSTDNLGVKGFDITFDIYDYIASGVKIREIAKRLCYICDRVEIKTDPTYDTIRLFWEDGREVENTDIEIRHYVTKVTARAGRKEWIEQLQSYILAGSGDFLEDSNNNKIISSL